NPVAGEYVIAGTRNIHQLVAVMLGSLVADHERATGPGHAEWLAMPQIFALSSGVLRNTLDIAGGLEIDPARMRANLDATQGLILAERVMMALAPAIGRQEAHDRVEAICRAVLRGEGTFAELLRRDAVCAARLSSDEVDRLLDPAGYTGEADRFIDRVLARAGRRHRGIEGGEGGGMPQADVNGPTIAYRIDGTADGPWLMLSNSLGTNLGMWDHQAAALGRRFRIIRYDSRGHGASGVPDGPYTMEMLGRDALGLLDHLGVERTHFVGLSK